MCRRIAMSSFHSIKYCLEKKTNELLLLFTFDRYRLHKNVRWSIFECFNKSIRSAASCQSTKENSSVRKKNQWILLTDLIIYVWHRCDAYLYWWFISSKNRPFSSLIFVDLLDYRWRWTFSFEINFNFALVIDENKKDKTLLFWIYRIVSRYWLMCLVRTCSTTFRCYSLFGYLTHELLGMNFDDFIHDDDQAKLKNIWNRSTNKNEWHLYI
jgi:hypothetical protein